MRKPSVLHLETLLDQRAEPFRRLIEESLQALLEAQMAQFIGAVAGERTQTRTGYRAGHVTRRLATRFGALELRVPRDRARRFRTVLLERYPRSENALIATLSQLFLRGCKAANVKAVAEELCGHALPANALELIRTGLEDALSRYESSTLEEPCPCLILQARREYVHLGGALRSRVVLMAIGSERKGRCQVLGVELVNRVSRKSWKALLRRLKHGGLHGVVRVVGEDRDGLRQAVRGTLGHCRLASSRSGLAERRAERSAARSAQERPGGDSIAAPAVADRAHDATYWQEVHEFIGWTPRAALNPEASCHRAPKDRQRAAMFAVLAGAIGAVGLLFWGIGPVVAPPREIVSTATEVHSAPRQVDPVPAPAPPAPVTRHSVTPAPMRSRFQLSGVAAAIRADGPGMALIGIDGGSPQVYRVGANVDGDLVLKGVTWDRATLGPARGAATLVLDVAAPAAPAPTVMQAAAARTWNVAGAIVEPTKPSAPDAGSMRPMAIAVADVQPANAVPDGTVPAAASNVAWDTASEAQTSSGSLPPVKRHRSRRLNASR
jgi:hypothetical protein